MSTAPVAAWRALGTGVRVAVTDPARLDAARAAVDEELRAVDAACSRFRDDSELSRANAVAGGTVRVGPLLAEAVVAALRAARLTGGDVDPTVGRAMVAIGYDTDFARVARRGGPLRLHVVPVPGWRRVHVDERAGTLRVPAGVALDLGAVAKGLAADRAAAAAHRAAGRGVLVSLGGDVAVAGDAPEGGWAVRVGDDSEAPPDAPGQTITIRDGGLATSSTAVRRWRRGDGEFHHIVDPRTSLPARGGLRTVSVCAATCCDANAVATAAIVRGVSALAWLEGLGLPARAVEDDGTVHHLAGWPVEGEQR